MISKEQVKHIAKLARIGLTETEIRKFQKELSSILDYFDALKEVDVLKVEPTFYSVERFFKKGLKMMREDENKTQPIKTVKKLREAAPDREKGYIKVESVFKND